MRIGLPVIQVLASLFVILVPLGPSAAARERGGPAGDTPSAPGSTDTAPSFLGMAVVTEVSRDPDGLTDLAGIRNAIWASRLPATEDLQVYTRWSGSGTHVIMVTIVDAGGDAPLGQTTDRLDLGAGQVTWFTHDFPQIVFPSTGVYAVEASVDGARVGTYALYVNAESELPPQPEFVISLPAGTGWREPGGTAAISGIFEYFSFPRFPAREDVSLFTVWFSGAGRFDQSMQILDGNGVPLTGSVHGTLEAVPGSMGVVETRFDSLTFPSPGIYTATVFLDGQRVVSYPLDVRVRTPHR